MGDRRAAIAQAKPLSPGEVLGCTAPTIKQLDAFVFVADGRFHLEAMMIANPQATAYRYDPYAKEMVQEGYDHAGMRLARRRAIEAARERLAQGGSAVAIFGTLGRQGNPRLVEHVCKRLGGAGPNVRPRVVLMSELHPSRLSALGGSVYVQVACPRLSIDWGEDVSSSCGSPMLTPFECEVATGYSAEFWGGGAYPMDYYAKDAGAWGSAASLGR